MIHRVREVTGKPVGIKAVIGQSGWLDEMCLHINERGLQYAPDFFTVDSADGTGAAPLSLMDYMGLPIQRSLPLVVDALVRHGLRGTDAGNRLRQAHQSRGGGGGAVYGEPTVSALRAASCLRWVACNHCNATRIPAHRHYHP